jgi:hypothetical protein
VKQDIANLIGRRGPNSVFRRQAMIFLHRLGIVFYWVGCVLAIAFATLAALVVVSGLISSQTILAAWPYITLSIVSWIWGRLMKYILSDA